MLVLALSLGALPGPAEGGWEWTANLGVGVHYDSNVTLTPQAESDTVYNIGPSVGVDYRGTSVDMTGGYNLYANIYTRHRNLNQITQFLTLNGDLSRAMNFILPKESTFHFTETLYNAPYLPDFESQVTPSPDVTTGGVRTPRNTTSRNAFGIDESTPLTPLSKFMFSYKNTFTRYSDPSLTDSQDNAVRIGMSTKLTRIDTLTGSGSYRRFDPYGGPTTHIYILNVGESHKFSPVTEGTVDLGVGWAFLPELNQPQTSFNGGVSGSTQLAETLRLNAGVAQDYSSSSGVGSVPLLNDSGSVTLEERFTNDLTGMISLNAARNRSISGAGNVDIRSQGTSVDLGYKFTKWLQGRLAYSYFHQLVLGDTDLNTYRSVVGLNFSAQWR